MSNHNFNSGAQNSRLEGSSMNKFRSTSTPQQVSAPPSPYLEARLFNLEVAHARLHEDVDALKDLYHGLSRTLGAVNPPLQDTDLVKSRQSAMHFMQELEQLSREVHESVNGKANGPKTNSKSTSIASGNVVPHVRASSAKNEVYSGKSLPPHLRSGKAPGVVNGNLASKASLDATKHKHEPLATDGLVDTIVRQTVPTAAPSPPLSPSTTVQNDASGAEVEAEALDDWKPYYLTTLPSLPAEICAKIPAKHQMATFSFDMLQNTFGGIAWSPGLRYINTTGAPLLQNRTYYMLDPMYEPYLPKTPGGHGAKLTAFFNKAPEEVFDNLPEGTNSYTDVPVFVQVVKGRYAYFGNYSQTRWSDKLDNDTMKIRVPRQVKEHIAKDLAAKPREDWVTKELKKHFFPKPEYEGAVLVPTSDDATVNTIDEEMQNVQMISSVKGYISELVEWEREASMKTAMIKPDFILKAFDAADADDPPALRLWWEYLECVDWKLDFYNMLVGFQARADSSK